MKRNVETHNFNFYLVKSDWAKRLSIEVVWSWSLKYIVESIVITAREVKKAASVALVVIGTNNFFYLKIYALLLQYTICETNFSSTMYSQYHDLVWQSLDKVVQKLPRINHTYISELCLVLCVQDVVTHFIQ